jgi:predicted ATP-grasp superfamily ATP-dependent carboligase
MMDPTTLRDPWLVATWPGMGSVGLLAGHYLARRGGAEPIGDLPTDGWFDVQGLQVTDGVVNAPQRPRTVLLGVRNPKGRDLVICLGEAQPMARGWEFCEHLLTEVGRLGVRRVVTFAAMAAPVEPAAPSRVFVAATSAPVLDSLASADVVRLEDGQIGGTNGLLLGAAAKRNLEGICLLGEFPYFASQLPNPKASVSVLRVFSKLAGLDLDLAELEEQGRQVERQLTDILDRLRKEAERRAAEGGGDEGGPPGLGGEDEEAPEFPQPDEEPPEPKPGDLTPEQRARVERLFAAAAKDRSQALQLKAELDRLGAFRRYEDRFLDLFKRAE